jgi:hypothetical protein
LGPSFNGGGVEFVDMATLTTTEMVMVFAFATLAIERFTGIGSDDVNAPLLGQLAKLGVNGCQADAFSGVSKLGVKVLG